MEGPRRDGRPGILRSQLAITAEGHVHIRLDAGLVCHALDWMRTGLCSCCPPADGYGCRQAVLVLPCLVHVCTLLLRQSNRNASNMGHHKSPTSALQWCLWPLTHAHLCRSLQNEPFSAVFHDRFKLSTGARRLKFDQKFQLLAPGVLPVKHYSIWHRIVEE